MSEFINTQITSGSEVRTIRIYRAPMMMSPEDLEQIFQSWSNEGNIFFNTYSHKFDIYILIIIMYLLRNFSAKTARSSYFN